MSGVQTRIDGPWTVHLGQAADLIGAGLARLEWIPGAPGNPKAEVTVDPDGNRIRRGAHGHGKHGPGSRRLFARSRGGVPLIEMWARMTEEQQQALEREHARLASAWPFPQVFGTACLEVVR